MDYSPLARESERLRALRTLYAAELRYHPTLLRLHGQIVAQEQRVSELTLGKLTDELVREREVIAKRDAVTFTSLETA